jgi:hypothetical protein
LQELDLLTWHNWLVDGQIFCAHPLVSNIYWPVWYSHELPGITAGGHTGGNCVTCIDIITAIRWEIEKHHVFIEWVIGQRISRFAQGYFMQLLFKYA